MKKRASTAELVKGMMKDAKLTPFQQRQLNAAMAAGQALPVRVHPTSSAPEAVLLPPAFSAPAAPAPKRVNPRDARPTIRTTIERGSRDAFVPAPLGVSRDRQKDQLSDAMAYGRDVAARREQLRRTGPSLVARAAAAASDDDRTSEDEDDAAMARRAGRGPARGVWHKDPRSRWRYRLHRPQCCARSRRGGPRWTAAPWTPSRARSWTSRSPSGFGYGRVGGDR
jgi:hypothetical protein